MQVCEFCTAEIAENRAITVMARRILSAVHAGYDPILSGMEPSGAKRREDFLVLLEMHDPTWTLCSACSGALAAFPVNTGGVDLRAPELIRIYGNGFRPEPRQWRMVLGAWFEKLDEKGVHATLAGAPIEIAECAHAPLEQFIEPIAANIIAETKREHAGCLVEEWILRYDDSVELLLIAVWSVQDSQAMSLEAPGRPSIMESQTRSEMQATSGGELWKPGDLVVSDIQICACKRGSMGIVYFCKHLGASMFPFVLKTLPGALLLDYRELFLREISTWFELAYHPHIVRAYNALEIEERLCLALEYVAGDARHGSDLSGWIGSPELDLKRALTFAWQICAGMRHALAIFQRAGKILIHRDLKPENLLVASPMQIKISDFGVAVLRDLAQARLPPETEEFGDRVYLSPEQCRGDLALDTRSDIYSFGCVLYEMLTGRTVFPIPRTSPEYIEAHLSEPPPDPRGVNASIPAAVCDVVMRCLQKEPKGRFDGFAAVQEHLGHLHEQLFSAPISEASPSRSTEPGAGLAGLMTRVFLGKTRAALETAEMTDKPEPIDAGQPGTIDRTTAIFTAEALAKEGRHKEGMEVLDHVIARQPSSSDLWNQRGRLLLNLGRSEDALASVDRALELDRRDPIILNNKAYILLELNRPQEALLCLELCLALNPRLAAAWNNKGRAHASLNEWAEASASYKKSVESNPAEAEVWFNWSVADANMQQIDLAKAHLRQSLAVDQLHWKALRNLAVLGREVGHTEDELATIADALDAQMVYATEHPEDLERLREVFITFLVLGREAEGGDLVATIAGVRQ
jgi:serine/threonine protein kinase